MSDKTIYQFTVQKLNGEQVSLSEYRDKVLLIVNTASECGFTHQLSDLEKLRSEFAEHNFEVLAFPSNDFGGQEPLSGSALSKFCAINFHTHFPVFEKIHVKGPKAHPLFRFLSDRRENGRKSSVPKWNFHKYLINRDGELEDFFYSFTKPCSARIKRQITRLLEEEPVLL